MRLYIFFQRRYRGGWNFVYYQVSVFFNDDMAQFLYLWLFVLFRYIHICDLSSLCNHPKRYLVWVWCDCCYLRFYDDSSIISISDVFLPRIL